MDFRSPTENVGSSALMDCQLTELQQAEHQLHQHAVSMLSCRESKAKASEWAFSSQRSFYHTFT